MKLKWGERHYSAFFYIIFFCFILTVNILQFPTVDDYSQWPMRPNIGDGLNFALEAYHKWNPRIGEFIFRWFLWSFGDTVYQENFIFGLANTLVTIGFFCNFFYLITGHFPKNSKNDVLIFALLFCSVYFSTSWATVFTWQAGAFNYLWSFFLISVWLIPCRNYITPPPRGVRNKSIVNDKRKNYIVKILWHLAFVLLSILVGLGGEFHAPVILFGLSGIFLYIVLHKKKIPPLWFILGSIAIFLGWIIFINAPGLVAKRQFVPTDWLAPVSGIVYLKRFLKRIFIFPPFVIFMNLMYLGYLFSDILKSPKKILLDNYIFFILFLSGIFGITLSLIISTIPERTFTLFFLPLCANLYLIAKKDILANLKNTKIFYGLAIFLIFISIYPLPPYIKIIFNSSLIIFGLYFHKNILFTFPKTFPIWIIPITLSVITYNIIEYSRMAQTVSYYIKEIECQKNQGIKKIYLQKGYSSPVTMYFDKSAAAEYYQVDFIEFIKPD